MPSPLPLLICRRQAIQCSTSDLGCYQRLTSPDVSCHHIESVEDVTSTVGPIRVSAHGLTLLRIDQLGGNSVLFPGARNLLNDEPTDTLSLADFESRSLRNSFAVSLAYELQS